MSTSRRSELMELGVGESAERPRRMFPPALMKSRRSFGVSAGP